MTLLDNKDDFTPGVVGTLIVNGGGEQLLIPEEEMKRLDNACTTACDTCGQSFEKRKGSGGKPQRFCSTKCRSTWHATKNEAEPIFDRSAKPAPAIFSPGEKPAADDDEFSWSEADVVIPSQPAIAVYFNPRGEVVIRQEGRLHPDEDHFVFVHMKNLMPLIDKLCDIAGIPSVGGD